MLENLLHGQRFEIVMYLYYSTNTCAFICSIYNNNNTDPYCVLVSTVNSKPMRIIIKTLMAEEIKKEICLIMKYQDYIPLVSLCM